MYRLFIFEYQINKPVTKIRNVMKTIIGFVDSNEMTKIHNLSKEHIIASCQGYDPEDINEAYIGQISSEKFKFFDLEDSVEVRLEELILNQEKFQIVYKNSKNVIFTSEEVIEDDLFVVRWGGYIDLQRQLKNEEQSPFTPFN